MRIVRLTEPALQDLREIYNFIARDNIDAAERLEQRLDKRCRAAAENPGIGRKRDEFRPDIRSINEGSYLIFYRQIEDGIEILRILHGARSLLDLDFNDL